LVGVEAPELPDRLGGDDLGVGRGRDPPPAGAGPGRVRGFQSVADRAECPRQQVLPGRGGPSGRPRAGTRDLNGGAAATGQNLHTALARGAAQRNPWRAARETPEPRRGDRRGSVAPPGLNTFSRLATRGSARFARCTPGYHRPPLRGYARRVRPPCGIVGPAAGGPTPAPGAASRPRGPAPSAPRAA